jgi:hypothetical protein
MVTYSLPLFRVANLIKVSASFAKKFGRWKKNSSAVGKRHNAELKI